MNELQNRIQNNGRPSAPVGGRRAEAGGAGSGFVGSRGRSPGVTAAGAVLACVHEATLPSPVGRAMIAQLTGLLAQVEADRCVIDVSGVGYLVQASTRTLSALPRPPEPTRVLVETVVREDAILLYGFADSAERDWFRLLTTVQGVGAKVALGVLSALSPRDLVAVLAAGDRSSLTRAPGVGARLAERILSELKDKAGGMPTSAGPTGPGLAVAAGGGIEADALAALGGLGFRRVEAHPVVLRIVERLGGGARLDAVIRDSLKEVAR